MIGETLNKMPKIFGDNVFIAKISNRNGIVLESSDTKKQSRKIQRDSKITLMFQIPNGLAHNAAIAIPKATEFLPPSATFAP